MIENTTKAIEHIGLPKIMHTIPFSIEDLCNYYKQNRTLNSIPLAIWDSIAGVHEDPNTGNITKQYTPFRQLMRQYPEYKDYTPSDGVCILKEATRRAINQTLTQPKISFTLIAEQFKDITFSLENGATIIQLPDESKIVINKKNKDSISHHAFYSLQYYDPNGKKGELQVTFCDSDEQLNHEVYGMLDRHYKSEEPDPTFYFTFGSDEKFPYQYGHLKITAPDKDAAIKAFNKLYPPRHNDNVVNCAFIYTEEQFEQLNKGPRQCHIHITVTKNSDGEDALTITDV